MNLIFLVTSLKVKQLFNVKRGVVISKKDILLDGKYPVYSSQTTKDGDIGRINSYMFDGEYITWTTDGANAGTVFYRRGKFNITNVCGILVLKDAGLDLKFTYHYLKLIAPNFVNKSNNNYKLMSNVFENIEIPLIPVNKQKSISFILDKFEKYNGEVSGILPNKIDLFGKQYRFYLNHLLKNK